MKVKHVLEDKRVFGEIRSVVVEQGERDPDHAFHVVSNLNWYRYEKQVESALQFLPSGGKVLDVGCGWGHTTAMLATSCPDLEVIGVDLVEARTWIELERYGAQFALCDSFALPFGNEFDAVTAFGVMEHTGGEERFLSEVGRVTKAGGCLTIFNLPNKYALSEWVARMLRIWSHERKYTMAEIEHLLKAKGFSTNTVRREFIVPAQVGRISITLGDLFNKYYLLLDKLDTWLARTPFACFAEAWAVYCKKSKCEQDEDCSLGTSLFQV